jgi:hypothetical protein
MNWGWAAFALLVAFLAGFISSIALEKELERKEVENSITVVDGVPYRLTVIKP